MYKEESLQISISRYLKLQYPEIYFMSDSSGLKLPMGLAVKAKKQRSKHAQLDLVILQPSGHYNGLILELKKSRNQVYKKNGEFRKGEHIEDQNKSIFHLSNIGYKCGYIFSLDEAIKTIDDYLLHKRNT